MPRARSCISTMRARAAAYGSTSPGAWFLSWPPGRITTRGYAQCEAATDSGPGFRRRLTGSATAWARPSGRRRDDGRVHPEPD